MLLSCTHHANLPVCLFLRLCMPSNQCVAYGMQAKPIEEAPAASTDGSPPPCAWTRAQTTITATLQLQDPLYPPWQPPPMPAVSLQQLIPKRQFVKAEDKPTASQVFQAQIQSAVKQLAVDYHKVVPTASGL